MTPANGRIASDDLGGDACAGMLEIRIRVDDDHFYWRPGLLGGQTQTVSKNVLTFIGTDDKSPREFHF
jgi:hypothetical protein